MILAKVRVCEVSAETIWCKPIPKGVIGAQVQFEYDPVWNGLKKTVVFKGAAVRDVIDAPDVVTIPAEVVKKSGRFLFVGVYGTDSDNVIAVPTLWASLGSVRDAADPSGDPSTDPELPIWAQLESRVKKLEDDAQHAAGGGGGSSGPAYVAAGEPPEDTDALWVNTSEPEESVALGVTATETAEGVDLYCTDELGTTRVSLRHGEDYVLTDEDIQEIAEIAAEMVEVPGANEFRLVNTIDISASEEPFHITLTESDDGVAYFEEEFVVEIESFTLHWNYYTISLKSGDLGVTVSDCRGANHRILHIHKLGARYVGVIYQDTAVNPGYPFDYQKTPVDIPVITELTIGPFKQFTGRVYARRKAGGSNA